MFNVTGSEIVIILVLALVVLGPEKLPDAIRKFGQFYGEFKKMSTGFQTEMRNALDEPLRELRGTADLAKGIFDQPAEELKKTTDALRGAISATMNAAAPAKESAPTDAALTQVAPEPTVAATEADPAGEPAQNEPAQNEPAQNEPAQNEPAQSEPVAAAVSNTLAMTVDPPGSTEELGPVADEAPFDPGPGPNFLSAAPAYLAEQLIIRDAGKATTEGEEPSE